VSIVVPIMLDSITWGTYVFFLAFLIIGVGRSSFASSPSSLSSPLGSSSSTSFADLLLLQRGLSSSCPRLVERCVVFVERLQPSTFRRSASDQLSLPQSLEEMDNVFGSGEGKADAERMYRIQTELLAANKLDILEDPSTRSAKVHQNGEKRDLV
jgi:hypothetical protein